MAKNPASQEIDVCLPTQNEVSSTFLHGFANARSAVNQITAVQVHIDNNLVYSDTSGATHVDAAFTVAKGPHSVVKAWDASGNDYSQSPSTCRSSSPNAASSHDFACLVLAGDFRLRMILYTKGEEKANTILSKHRATGVTNHRLISPPLIKGRGFTATSGKKRAGGVLPAG